LHAIPEPYPELREPPATTPGWTRTTDQRLRRPGAGEAQRGGIARFGRQTEPRSRGQEGTGGDTDRRVGGDGEFALRQCQASHPPRRPAKRFSATFHVDALVPAPGGGDALPQSPRARRRAVA
jgi:hypothetical protein